MSVGVLHRKFVCVFLIALVLMTQPLVQWSRASALTVDGNPIADKSVERAAQKVEQYVRWRRDGTSELDQQAAARILQGDELKRLKASMAYINQEIRRGNLISHADLRIGSGAGARCHQENCGRTWSDSSGRVAFPCGTW